MSLTVRPAEPRDLAAWRQLFSAYNKFYPAHVPSDVVSETWRRISDPSSNIGAVIAERNGIVAGFAVRSKAKVPASTSGRWVQLMAAS